LKQANSKNYHHFFPKSWLKKQGYEDRVINHIANITLVDDYLNKRVIGAQAPAVYIRKIQRENPSLERTLATHYIGKPESVGILNNDYELFFKKRCQKLSLALGKLILADETDGRMMASPASQTIDTLSLESSSD